MEVVTARFSETVRWQVRTLEHMEEMDAETFDSYFGNDKTWCTSLSNGRSQPLRVGGANDALLYDDRHEYVRLAKQARMTEFDSQVDSDVGLGF